MKRVGLGVLARALALCVAVPAIAAKSPDKLVLAAGSPTAVIVLKSEWWQPAPSMLSAWKLALSSYDAAGEKLAAGPYGGVLIEARKKAFAEGYLIVPVKPGRYAFVSYSQQDLWALCFNAATLQFEVKPGEVVYLGAFDAPSHREQLVQQAMMSGKGSIRGYGFADFFDQPDGPRFAPIDEAQLGELRAVLGRSATGISAPVRAVQFAPARFGTGSTLFAERKCGGYFPVSAAEKAKAPR